jgi:hypothetical protein
VLDEASSVYTKVRSPGFITVKQVVPIWIGALSLFSIAISFLYLIYKNHAALDDPRLFVVFVAAITTIVTTLGSSYIAGFNAKQKFEQDRSTESRKLKIDYYNKFLDALTLKMSDPHDTDINKSFCMEKNRLPLCASTQVVELVEKVPTGKTTIVDLYVEIRKDLATSEFSDLSDLQTNLTIHLSSLPQLIIAEPIDATKSPIARNSEL